MLFAYPFSTKNTLVWLHNYLKCSKDHFTSKGQDLRKIASINIADILLQDRMNFHKYTGGDPGDEDDLVYAKLGQDAFRSLYENKPVSVSPEIGDQVILNRTPLVEVTVNTDSISVQIIEQGDLVDGKPEDGDFIPPSVARPFTGSGRVYSIPELKNLVGRRLNNAWLAGDFVFKGWTGNVAHCVTAAIVLFAKEGGTDVDIAFDDGISVSPQTRLELSRPAGMVSLARIPATNPAELISVERQVNGRLLVRARHAASLNM